MNKVYYTWQKIDHLVHGIALDLYRKEWVPDYIVGVVRGGAIPGIQLSHIMNKPFLPLDIRLRDNVVSNAMGFQHFFDIATHFSEDKKVLFIDDINDSSGTLAYIDDRMLSNRDNLTFKYEFAMVLERVSAPYSALFVGEELTEKATDGNPDAWIVFPWENQFNIPED